MGMALSSNSLIALSLWPLLATLSKFHTFHFIFPFHILFFSLTGFQYLTLLINSLFLLYITECKPQEGMNIYYLSVFFTAESPVPRTVLGMQNSQYTFINRLTVE